ncbi:MAG: hypothetical protein LC734_02245 [Acidobacteria bacterium]|nr:hypothetical protein [Acidobacteriota bacterium]
MKKFRLRMVLSLLLVLIVTIGGLAVSYLIDSEERLLWRLAAGNVIGSAIFGTATFVIGLAGGLTVSSAIFALAFTMLPLILFLDATRRDRLRRDWKGAKDSLNNANFSKALSFLYYAAFLLLLILFFGRAMYETAAGIFTGGSQNFGDLPFHLGAIFSFSEANNFPPQNPSFAGAKFSYPFIADLLTAAYLKLGADIVSAMLVQNVSWAFSLVVILDAFVRKLTADYLAAKLAPPLLFFSGGLGFLYFFSDFAAQNRGFIDFLWRLPTDYTISEAFRWGNPLIVLFITQRSILLGMPITLVVLGVLWKIFNSDPDPHNGDRRISFATVSFQSSLIAVGLLAGLLVLIHLHSLAVLFVVSVFLILMNLDRVRLIGWVTFGISTAVIAVPELIWTLMGSATDSGEFIAWHFGWDKRENNVLWFWLKNLGIFIPLLIAGLFLVYQNSDTADAEKSKSKITSRHAKHLLLFYIPFAFLFVLCNAAKLAPWEWDNIKVLIYWFVGSIPFVALLLSWLWRQKFWMRAGAIFCLVVLTLSGVLDVWRTVSGQINNKIFDRDAIRLAERLRSQMSKDALFLNAATFNSAIVLTGRPSLMRYPGHLGSHGIDYAERERDVQLIYAGRPDAEQLMAKYNISYVLMSPEERRLGGNENYFRKFPVVAESGDYRVFKVR